VIDKQHAGITVLNKMCETLIDDSGMIAFTHEDKFLAIKASDSSFGSEPEKSMLIKGNPRLEV